MTVEEQVGACRDPAAVLPAQFAKAAAALPATCCSLAAKQASLLVLLAATVRLHLGYSTCSMC